MSIRDYIKIVESGTNRKNPFPTRQGNSIGSWKQYIIDVMAWKRNKYGPDIKWEVKHEEAGPMFRKAADKLADEDIITLRKEVEHYSSSMGDRHFGRSGYVSGGEFPLLIITVGTKFPADI